ncbi:DUF4124 domain-containing protein [Psychrobacter sp.]|uniref:DUF4124 domain-containing protein n=1 Tax=Psychrobacter sp. TaxID=56811 RepID=UPI002648740B|nr:DUF4124 domain-containing protein [Psychrobacter sp.]MDN6276637.1 DUF4124 domain-containing protein [Psychrobacter sp.]MDN6308878.1 DUF4124 domain-containing protein [Psychrobacter sp.]
MTYISNFILSKNRLKLGLLAIMAIFSLSSTHSAPIYKVVNEQTGQVTFTDRPQSYEQQAGKQVSQTGVMTGSGSVDSSVNTTNSQSSNTSSTSAGLSLEAPSEDRAPISYQISIVEPSEERAYRRPAQSIDVSVQVTPTLQPGDSVSIYLDGSEVATGLSAFIATTDVTPGPHNLEAVIKTEKGEVLNQDSLTVYVIQNNTTLQTNKQIAQQLAAYQNLSWHQKLLLKLRQNDSTTPSTQSNQPATSDAFSQ